MANYLDNDIKFVAGVGEARARLLEKELGIDTYAVNWPIGCGKEFKGVYDRQKNHIMAFEAASVSGTKEAKVTIYQPDDPKLEPMVGERLWETLQDDIELLGGCLLYTSDAADE